MEIPYELLVKFCRNHISDEEKRQVEQWLSDDKNLALFNKFQEEWLYINEDSIVIPDRSQVWNNIKLKMEQDGKTVRKSGSFKVIMSIAAVVIVLAVSSVIYFSFNSTLPVEPEQYAEFGTDSGEKLQIELTDGTFMWMNSSSSVTFNETSAKRELFLDGEIFIDVFHSDKPFVINTDKIRVEVLGTLFNIIAFHNDDHIEIDLSNGSIKVVNLENEEELLKMLAPQYVRINKVDMTYSLQKSNSEYSAIWAQESLVIDNDPLYEVIKKLKNWYGIDIYYNEPDTTRSYTFQLQDEDIYEFLELFSFITPIDYVLDGKKLYIENRKDK
ncbi:MAG: FecR family protein [Bacteroidales bacterium]|jgi:ferric-dicitrate binding protein FerR (iron transport regulator)|nr:FecR family protein [Bacteroidales bacterium]